MRHMSFSLTTARRCWRGEMIKLTAVDNLGTVCPSQWELADRDGGSYYVRFRHGYISVENMGTDECYGRRIDHHYAGYMGTPEMLRIIRRWGFDGSAFMMGEIIPERHVPWLTRVRDMAFALVALLPQSVFPWAWVKTYLLFSWLYDAQAGE